MGFFSTVSSGSSQEYDRIISDAMNEGAMLVGCGVIYLGYISGIAQFTYWAQLVSPELAGQVRLIGD
jgi:hypothetical protein